MGQICKEFPLVKTNNKTIMFGRYLNFSSLSKAPSFPAALLRRLKYTDRVLDHYSKPRNVGSFDPSNRNVGTGLVGAPACGDVMKLQIIMDRSGKIIKDARFKTFGCGSAIASSSIATEWIKGKKITDALLTVTNKRIADFLLLPPVKLHCSLLAADAIKAAIRDFQGKQITRFK